MSLIQIISTTINKFQFDNQTLSEITAILNVSIEPTQESNILPLIIEKLKTKLYDIFLSEGKNYTDYLKLPKFTILKPQTKNKLNKLFDQIWQLYQFQNHQENQPQFDKNKNYQIINNMLPEFKSLNQIQAFHLQMFAQFKNNKFLKENPPQINKSFVPPTQFSPYPYPHGVDPVLAGFHRPGINPNMPPPFYPKMDNDFMNNNPNMMGRIYPNMSAHPLNSSWMEQRQQSQASNFMPSLHPSGSNIPNSQFPIPHFPQQNRPFYPQMQKQPNNLNTEQNMNVPKLKPAYQSNKTPTSLGNLGNKNQSSIEQQQPQIQNDKLMHITGEQNEFQQKFKHYQFVECACEGNFKSQSHFQCKMCNYLFHYECLNISEDDIIEMCPCCKLRQGSNIFIKIHPQPFGKRWCKMNDRQKLSMFLTQREIQKMKAIKQKMNPNSVLQYQLRFLKKSNPRNCLKNTQTNRKVSNTSNNGEGRKFNNLPLPSGYVEKIRPYNVFQISLRPKQNKSSNPRQDEECLYIFGIFMVEKYSEMSITQNLFSNLSPQNSIGEQHLQKYLIDPQQGLQIKLIDATSQQAIRYPVRGDHCQHPQVFDCLSILQYYKQYGEKLFQMHCPVCENQFSKIIADRFLYSKLRQNSTENYQENYQKLRYYGHGKVDFIQAEKQPSEESNNNSNKNQQNEMNAMDGEVNQSGSEMEDQENSGSSNEEQSESQSLSC